MDEQHKPVGLVVLMPTRGAVSIETLICLRDNLDGYPSKLLTVFRKPVEEACNELHRQACELDPETLYFVPKYVMGIADDTYWAPGLVSRTIEILQQNPDIGVVSPLGSFRTPYAPPTCVPIHEKHRSGKDNKVGILKCELGELIPLRLFTGGIMRREVLDVITDEPFKRMTYHMNGTTRYQRTLAMRVGSYRRE
jgi:hypothetical protein